MDDATLMHLDNYRNTLNLATGSFVRSTLLRHLLNEHADEIPSDFNRRVPSSEWWALHFKFHARANDLDEGSEE